MREHATTKTGRLATLAAVGTVASALALTACGGSGSSSSTSSSSSGTPDSSTSGQLTEAQAAVEKLQAPVAWKAPGPPIKDVASVKGKRLYFIANGLNIPFNAQLAAATKEAGTKVGIGVTVVDAKGSAAEASRLMDEAVGQHYDIIVDEAQTVSQLTAPLKNAKAAGIPVIMQYQGDPRPPTPEERAVGMVAQVTQCYSCAGKALADYVIADSKGKANVAAFAVPEQSVANTEQKGFTDEMKRLCPDCKVKVVDLPIAQWQTNAQTLTSSTLKVDPKINYLFPMYDGVETLMEPALNALPNGHKVKIVSLNASQTQMESLAKGGFVAAEAGFSLQWAGYATIDQALRVMTGMQPSADSHIGMRLFASTNIGQIDLKKDESTWYGIDVVPKFTELWGLSS